jgi:Outer membrane protein beta-barrel domain
MSRRSSIVLPLMLLTAGGASAQSAQAISLQVSGIYNGLYGDVFDNLNSGVGGEAQIRYTPGALSLGLGAQYTIHSLDAPFTENAQFLGAFFEPRYRIHTGSNVVAPYVSARFAWLNMGFSGDDLSVSSDFIQLNAGGGLLYRVGPRLNLDLGATFGYNRLGAGTFDSKSRGRLKTFGAESGTNVVVRFGFAFGIGG